MHCGVDLDDKGYVSHDSIDSALDRARDRGEVAELYAHNPGETVSVSTIEYVLAGARDRGLAFVTYADFADPDATPRAGLALSFDDTSIDAWFAQRALFQQYDARITFFLSRYRDIYDSQRAELQQLHADGHDVEAHTVNHLRGPDYVEQYGLDAYMADEIVPSIDILEADGYTVQVFAYPFGARTSETDRAILDHVRVLRSVLFTWPEASSPCPL
jgi:peptidoglycan/xylan/chitin deacetylase (PgdA/CDA1 family)